jgi:hypothetical protein
MRLEIQDVMNLMNGDQGLIQKIDDLMIENTE